MSTPPDPQRPAPPAAPGGTPFPGLLGALWLVLASMVLESLAWALLGGGGGGVVWRCGGGRARGGGGGGGGPPTSPPRWRA